MPSWALSSVRAYTRRCGLRAEHSAYMLSLRGESTGTTLTAARHKRGIWAVNALGIVRERPKSNEGRCSRTAGGTLQVNAMEGRVRNSPEHLYVGYVSPPVMKRTCNVQQPSRTDTPEKPDLRSDASEQVTPKQKKFPRNRHIEPCYSFNRHNKT